MHLQRFLPYNCVQNSYFPHFSYMNPKTSYLYENSRTLTTLAYVVKGFVKIAPNCCPWGARRTRNMDSTSLRDGSFPAFHV